MGRASESTLETSPVIRNGRPEFDIIDDEIPHRLMEPTDAQAAGGLEITFRRQFPVLLRLPSERRTSDREGMRILVRKRILHWRLADIGVGSGKGFHRTLRNRE